MHRRARHLNPGSAGAVMALDSRFITGLSDGDPVSTWTDRSGSGNDATQSGTARPTFETNEQGGQPVLRFNGSNTYLTAGGSLLGPQNHSVIILCKRTTGVGFNSLLLGASPETGGLYYGFISHDKFSAGEKNASVDVQDPATTNVNLWQVFSGIMDSGLLRLFRQAAECASGNCSPSAPNTTDITIGTESVGANNFFPGDLANLVVSDVVFTDPLRRRLEHAAAFAFKIPCN